MPCQLVVQAISDNRGVGNDWLAGVIENLPITLLDLNVRICIYGKGQINQQKRRVR